MNTKLGPIYITLLMMLCASHVYPSQHGRQVKESKEKNGITLAVMEIQAHNCSPSLGMAVRDMLYHRLFESEMFILLEKEKTDIFFRVGDFNREDLSNPQSIARLGNQLAVKKIITGSLSRLDDYRIDLRIVDAGKGTVDLSISHNCRGEAHLEHAVSRLVERAKLFYAGYPTLTGRTNASINAAFLYPVGKMASFLYAGLGSSFIITLNDFILQRYPLIFSAGFFALRSYHNSVEHFYMIPITLSAGYPIRISQTVRMIAKAGCGYMASHVSYDDVEVRTHGNYQYNEGLFFNPMLTGRCSFEILLGHRWYLDITPAYMVFFDSGRAWQLVSLNTGITMLF